MLSRGAGGQRLALVEQLAELPPDLTAPRLAFLSLMRVNAQGGVGLSVPEPALDVDDGDVEGDQHAGVAVAQVVQTGLRDPGVFDSALEHLAGDLAFEPTVVAAREHERRGVKQRAALGDERDEAACQLGRDVDRPP